MYSDIDGASVLKTLIGFKEGAILRVMSERRAASNALLCFDLFPEVRGRGRNTPLPSSITESGAYDVMKHHQFKMEQLEIDDHSHYVYGLDIEEVKTINSAYTAISEMLCDSNELPILGGKEAIDRIHKAILKDGTH